MFKIIKIQLEIFASLQTLFPPLKIDIFCRIVPLSFIKKLIKIQLEIFAPLQTLFFSLWKLTFSVASSPYFSLRIWNESSWKNFWTLQTLFPSLKIVIFCRIVPQLGRAEFFG